MLTLKQFKHALLLDEITDITPYLESKHPAYLREMVRQGICVEQLSQLNIIPVTILLIETDQAQEHYDEWLEHPNMNVRWALARKVCTLNSSCLIEFLMFDYQLYNNIHD